MSATCCRSTHSSAKVQMCNFLPSLEWNANLSSMYGRGRRRSTQYQKHNHCLVRPTRYRLECLVHLAVLSSWYSEGMIWKMNTRPIHKACFSPFKECIEPTTAVPSFTEIALSYQLSHESSSCKTIAQGTCRALRPGTHSRQFPNMAATFAIKIDVSERVVATSIYDVFKPYYRNVRRNYLELTTRVCCVDATWTWTWTS